MEQLSFCRVQSSIREQRTRLKTPWDRVVRLHSPDPTHKHMRIVTLSDAVAERSDGFVPTFGGEKLKDHPPCKSPTEAMQHGIQYLHQQFVTINDVGPYLDVALYQPKPPRIVITNDDTGECIGILELHFRQ